MAGFDPSGHTGAVAGQGNRVNGAEPLHAAAEQRFLTEVTEIKATEDH